MSKYRKALIAFVAPVILAVYPFFADGWDFKTDIGPVIVAVLVALGVYAVPNTEPRVGKLVP